MLHGNISLMQAAVLSKIYCFVFKSSDRVTLMICEFDSYNTCQLIFSIPIHERSFVLLGLPAMK